MPFTEKQTMTMGLMGVYRPHHNGGVPHVSYSGDGFDGFVGFAMQRANTWLIYIDEWHVACRACFYNSSGMLRAIRC